MPKIKENFLAQLAIIYTRYLLGGALVFASLIKIKGNRFTTESGLHEPIDTAWHLFETLYQSGLYWQFIGIGQLLAGFLLLTQRYSKLGALVSLPITLNIFIITLSYYFAWTPVITGAMLTANLLLIIWDWNTFKVLFNLTPSKNTSDFERNRIWEITGMILFLYTALYRTFIDEYHFLSWIITMSLIGSIGLIIYLIRHKDRFNIFS